MPELIGMMRVKNEERWIERAILPLLHVCRNVYVLDDHSTDRTLEIARDMGCICLESPFETLDESRDKTFLLQFIQGQLPRERFTLESPYWVICVDVDEMLHFVDLEQLKDSKGLSYCFKILTLYDSPDQIRVDGPYEKMLRPSMFRLCAEHLTFKNTKYGAHFHCSNVPAEIGFRKTTHFPPVRLLHYGYMLKEDRERKLKFYLEHDPENRDWYERECLGSPTLAQLAL